MISSVDSFKPFAGEDFKSAPVLQNLGFLNCRSAVRSCPGTPALIKHTQKPSPNNKTAYLTGIYSSLLVFPEITVGRTRGESNTFQNETSKDSGEFMANAIYKITVINWEKHNKHIKRGHKASLIQNNFCTDAKLRAVPLTVRWMFLGIILTCGDHTRACVEMGERQLRDLLESSWSVPIALDALKELQLVSYDKIDLFINRIEVKRREIKRKETPLKGTHVLSDASQPPESAAPAIAAYCDFWRKRYKSEKSPPIMPHHAKQIKQLVKQVGDERSKKIIEVFLSMPDSWFITKRHDIPTMMGNLNSITQFMETGKMFTRGEIRQVDAAATAHQTVEALRRGEV